MLICTGCYLTRRKELNFMESQDHFGRKRHSRSLSATVSLMLALSHNPKNLIYTSVKYFQWLHHFPWPPVAMLDNPAVEDLIVFKWPKSHFQKWNNPKLWSCLSCTRVAISLKYTRGMSPSWMQCTAARLSLWHNDIQPPEQSKFYQLFPLYLGILLVLGFVSTYACIWGFTQDFGGIQNLFKKILFSVFLCQKF